MSTMRQVGDRAGVSAKTVSRVVRKDGYVSEEVRRRVEQAIVDLRYVPNELARTFRAGRDVAIGVAVPDISDPFFANVTHAVEQVARARRAPVFVTSLGDDGAHERAGVEALLGRQIAGLICTPISADQSYLRPWQAQTRIVFIDRSPSGIVADTVVEDDVGGAHAATTHLLDHGHRRVAFVGDSTSTQTTRRRLKGYQAALSDAGMPADRRLIGLGVMADADVVSMTSTLLRMDDPPTALFSSNTRYSISLVLALQELGRRDVALVSFGDFPLAAALEPALTAIDQDPAAVGRLAANRLFEGLDDPAKKTRRKLVLPVRLVTRASCCARPPLAPARAG